MMQSVHKIKFFHDSHNKELLKEKEQLLSLKPLNIVTLYIYIYLQRNIKCIEVVLAHNRIHIIGRRFTSNLCLIYVSMVSTSSGMVS